MTNQEMNLIQTIRESNNPNALAIATTIIISHLKRHESSVPPCPAVQPALD